MSLPHIRAVTSCALAVALIAVAAPTSAGAVVESDPVAFLAADPGQVLTAPFTCGSEWSGSTYAGHGLNDWNLDLNRTSLVWPDTGHDLGQPILAQGDGTVVWFEQDGYNNGAGAYLEIDYGDVTVRYIHLVEQSIPPHLAEIGATVVRGELIGALGGTGNASHPHLHLEYWDSSGYDDTPRWELPAANQIQITIDGVVIAPDQAFTSTNCDGPPLDPYPFSDVPTASFAYDDIAQLAEIGMTTGTSPDTFEPRADVTREQMAAFLARLWMLVDAGASNLPDSLDQPFEDVDTGSFAYDAIALLSHLEITTGTSPTTFEPLLAVTREQMAAFLSRLWTLLDGGTTEIPDELPQPFEDVESPSFAHDHIALLAHLEITTGTSPTTYDPLGVVSREQMAAFLARLYRLLVPAEPDPDRAQPPPDPADPAPEPA
jgi:hypothetical protein